MPLIRSKSSSTTRSQVKQLAYTVSQSSHYPTVTPGSYQNLTDGDIGRTGTGTNQDSPAWIQIDLGAIKTIRLMAFRGNTLDGWGAVTKYDLEGKYLQSSNDAASWINLLVINNVPHEYSTYTYPAIPFDKNPDWIEKFSDSYLSQQKLYVIIPLNIQGRYFRVYGYGYTALSEWFVFGY